jgi:hypothetical protein
MSHLIFAAPWGWLGLLGLVWVVIVHSLQQVTRRERVSTLFLLERLQLESKEGRSLTWLRQTIPFWLQILCVLLLTWLLLDPRWQHRDEVQQVVVVMDSTLSMEAFRPDWPTKLEPVLLRLGALAPMHGPESPAHLSWHRFCSWLEKAERLAGDSLDE